MATRDSKPLNDLAQIEEEHRTIIELIQQVKELLGNYPPDDASAWVGDLRSVGESLLNHLDKHFRLEEEGGFMAQLVEISPRTAAAAERLPHEHDEIRNLLSAILEILDSVAVDSMDLKSVLDQIQQLIHTLEHHEKTENALIQEVYNQDIGVGD